MLPHSRRLSHVIHNAAVGAVVCLAGRANAAPAIYDLSNSGGFVGGQSVNASGQVGGSTSITNPGGNPLHHAIRYDGIPGAGGVLRDLGTLGGAESFGWGINDAGQVAGRSLTSVGFMHAFRYDGTPGSGGVMRDLGALGVNVGSQADGINNLGQAAGYSFTSTTNNTYHAFRYDGTPGAGGVMRDLGTLSGGWSSVGRAVNDAGQVAGETYDTNSIPDHFFRYDGTPGAGGVMRDLGPVSAPNLGGFAADINNAGQVTGYNGGRAFRYDGTPGAGGVMRDLGTVGGEDSAGLGINDAGQVVGWSYTPDNSRATAFFFSGTPGVDGLMIDLDAWLDANNPVEGTKWTLTGATGISNTGWITGTGLYDPDGPGGVDGTSSGFLLDASSLVPEPASLAMLIVGAATLARRRSTRRGRWRNKVDRKLPAST